MPDKITYFHSGAGVDYSHVQNLCLHNNNTPDQLDIHLVHLLNTLTP